VNENGHVFDGSVSSGLVIGGFSAGGQLASSLVVRARNGHISVPIHGLILRSLWLLDWRAISPHLKESLQSIEENANAPYVSSERLRLMLQWLNVPENERLDPNIFSLHMDQEMAAGLPPVVVQVSGADPLRDEGGVFHNLMQRSGVSSRLFHYEVCVCPKMVAAFMDKGFSLTYLLGYAAWISYTQYSNWCQSRRRYEKQLRVDLGSTSEEIGKAWLEIIENV
jgi:acetyl esterase/lipase